MYVDTSMCEILMLRFPNFGGMQEYKYYYTSPTPTLLKRSTLHVWKFEKFKTRKPT